MAWTQEAIPQRVQEINGMHIELLKVNSGELFGLLKTKHNKTTNSIAKDVVERNGFELYWLMSQE